MLDFPIGRYDAVMSCAKLRVGLRFFCRRYASFFAFNCVCVVYLFFKTPHAHK